eukprot:GHVP01058159.1.p1 GENE.GHVP01058159.1~~GHVP01058159.1.p1  ORF type:complete len:195 (+),score=32.54 GHVP01058159.1:295-879(+)
MYQRLSPYRKIFDFPPSDAGQNEEIILQKLNGVFLDDKCLPEMTGDFILSEQQIDAVHASLVWMLESYPDEIPLPNERGLQDLFTIYFLRPLIQKHNRLESDQRTISFVPLGEEFEADLLILSQSKGVTVLEMKKDNHDLTKAILQAALYALQYHIQREEQMRVCVLLAAVSLPNFSARIGRRQVNGLVEPVLF